MYEIYLGAWCQVIVYKYFVGTVSYLWDMQTSHCI